MAVVLVVEAAAGADMDHLQLTTLFVVLFSSSYSCLPSLMDRTISRITCKET
jgi:hypothetical protein